MLEDETDTALACIDAQHTLALDHDIPGIRPFEPGDDAQKRGLARA